MTFADSITRTTGATMTDRSFPLPEPLIPQVPATRVSELARPAPRRCRNPDASRHCGSRASPTTDRAPNRPGRSARRRPWTRNHMLPSEEKGLEDHPGGRQILVGIYAALSGRSRNPRRARRIRSAADSSRISRTRWSNLSASPNYRRKSPLEDGVAGPPDPDHVDAILIDGVPTAPRSYRRRDHEGRPQRHRLRLRPQAE